LLKEKVRTSVFQAVFCVPLHFYPRRGLCSGPCCSRA
jgi:hypothetical protein